LNGRPVCIGQCHEDSRLHRTRRFDRLNRVGRGGLVSTRHFRGPKTACGRSHKLAIGLNSRSAIRDWRGITNRTSDATRIAKRASDQNGGIGSSTRLEAPRQQSRRRYAANGFAFVPIPYRAPNPSHGTGQGCRTERVWSVHLHPTFPFRRWDDPSSTREA
jgi:hypothetical protein